MTGDTTKTLDAIHVGLERLGYVGEEFRAARLWRLSYAVYRKPGETVAVSWAAGCSVYELSAGSLAAVELLYAVFTAAGLICRAAGTRLEVHGQEHIDTEVRKMLAR